MGKEGLFFWLSNLFPPFYNMKTIFSKFLILTLTIGFGFIGIGALNAQVKVGDNPDTIDPESVLELESTGKGFLPPRMATADRPSGPPAEGMVIYNTDIQCLETYNGTTWISLCDDSDAVDHDWYHYTTATPPLNINDTIYTNAAAGVNNANPEAQFHVGNPVFFPPGVISSTAGLYVADRTTIPGFINMTHGAFTNTTLASTPPGPILTLTSADVLFLNPANAGGTQFMTAGYSFTNKQGNFPGVAGGFIAGDVGKVEVTGTSSSPRNLGTLGELDWQSTGDAGEATGLASTILIQNGSSSGSVSMVDGRAEWTAGGNAANFGGFTPAIIFDNGTADNVYVTKGVLDIGSAGPTTPTSVTNVKGNFNQINLNEGTVTATKGYHTYLIPPLGNTLVSVDTVIGLQIDIHDPTSKIPNAYGVKMEKVDALIAGGNAYGIHMGPGVVSASGGAQYAMYVEDASDNYFEGSVGIGCNAPQYPLHVDAGGGAFNAIGANGNILASGTITGITGVTACSDLRYKKNIKPLENALDVVMRLRGVGYDYRVKKFASIGFPDRHQIGFIAQELEKEIPEVVFTDQDGYKSVDYSKVTPILLEAIKELKLELDAKDKEIEELKASINKKDDGYKALRSQTQSMQKQMNEIQSLLEMAGLKAENK